MAATPESPEKPTEKTSASLLDHLPPDRPVFNRPLSDAFPPTFEEYQEVALWTASCIESVGAELVFGTDSEVEEVLAPVPGISASGLYVFLTGRVAPGSPAGSGVHALDFCRMMSDYEDVEMYYVNSPTQEDIDAWYESLRICLVESGVEDVDSVMGPKTVAEPGDNELHEDLAKEKVPTHCWP